LQDFAVFLWVLKILLRLRLAGFRCIFMGAQDPASPSACRISLDLKSRCSKFYLHFKGLYNIIKQQGEENG